LRQALSSVVEASLDYAGLVRTVHGMGYRFSTRVK
jgi:DNA-binding winged helix-turn-helix (wHTH) protein